MSVAAAEVTEIRRIVMAAAGDAGLDADQAARFTLAVNEIVINAILHGGGTAHVTVTGHNGRVSVDVRDNGPGFATTLPSSPPPPGQLNGRGLWLARNLCDDVTMHNTGNGTVVRLTAARNR
jgi:serine/threonine-protein kinase RsbW